MDSATVESESNAVSETTFFFKKCVAFDINLVFDISKSVQIIYCLFLLPFAGNSMPL